METFILKYDVYNSIDFPKGTIIRMLEEDNHSFIVTKGKLKGKTGFVAAGLGRYLLDNTIDNRELFRQFKDERKRLEKAIQDLDKKWTKLT